jgi:hypothetical protein
MPRVSSDLTIADAGEGVPRLLDIIDVPTLSETVDADALVEFEGEPQFDSSADPEVDTQLRLNGDRSFRETPKRRLFVDYRADADAYKHLQPLPGPGESLHGVISGKYALFEMIPALIAHCGPIKDLTIATLSFNKQNAADLLALLDDGHVFNTSLLISYYFKSTSRPIYDLLIPPLRERGHRVLAMRNHAKLLLVRTVAGDHFVVETSANLRSSVNVEAFVMTRDPALYAFHVGWIDELFSTQTDLGGA